MFSIEDIVWDSQEMSESAAVGQGQGASRRVHTRERGLGDNLKAPPLQRHFWVRNAPYRLTNLGNSLISQQMRPPSERTTGNKPLIRRIFSRFLDSHIVTHGER